MRRCDSERGWREAATLCHTKRRKEDVDMTHEGLGKEDEVCTSVSIFL